MKNINSILVAISIITLFISCDTKNKRLDDKELYNKKANELILQILKKGDCDCMIKIGINNISMIARSKADNPIFDIDKYLINNLNLKNKSSLDSIDNMSSNFRLDINLMKKNNIKIVTIDEIDKNFSKNDSALSKKCQKGIISMRKPIFNKSYSLAAIDFSFLYSCIGTSPYIYKYYNGKWISVK